MRLASRPILKSDEEKLRLRVWLTSKFEETLRDALQMLGLPAPSRM
ncbi:DALR anticodon-binding domain-containing protein [Paenibacillus kobensis]|nr:DALR anticodon-binding domain-containing protein [Paenibacillus kobensis]